ncbi:hypothetical protein AB0G85_35495 [Streptomyces sioyaensis]|uniref:hypothetical protein n=1 Tax=Streptomyces sioyaensis TaxID=67364 RepID=UPI0033CC6615
MSGGDDEGVLGVALAVAPVGVEPAFGAVRTKDTYLQARYKLTARRGPLALAAVEHSIITAIWHITDNALYHELGGTY